MNISLKIFSEFSLTALLCLDNAFFESNSIYKENGLAYVLCVTLSTILTKVSLSIHRYECYYLYSANYNILIWNFSQIWFLRLKCQCYYGKYTFLIMSIFQCKKCAYKYNLCILVYQLKSTKYIVYHKTVYVIVDFANCFQLPINSIVLKFGTRCLQTMFLKTLPLVFVDGNKFFQFY